MLFLRSSESGRFRIFECPVCKFIEVIGFARDFTPSTRSIKRPENKVQIDRSGEVGMRLFPDPSGYVKMTTNRVKDAVPREEP